MIHAVNGSVVLIHGLVLDDNRFKALRAIEDDFVHRGFAVHKFPWPERFTPRRVIQALRDPGTEFLAELADEFNNYLKGLADKLREGRWVIVAHCLGGSMVLKWLVTHSQSFLKNHQTLPEAVMIFAALHRCPERAVVLPTGYRARINEKDGDLDEIVSRLPGRLFVFFANRDTTALYVNTAFPQQMVEDCLIYQHEISNTTHDEICNMLESRALVFAHLGLPSPTS